MYGGIHTILRLAQGVADHGTDSRIVLPDMTIRERRRVTEVVSSQGIRLPVVFGKGSSAQNQAVVATHWTTVYSIMPVKARKFYFIQDYEPEFYAAGPTKALAEQTYLFPAKWIIHGEGVATYLETHFGRSGVVVRSAVDSAIYNSTGRRRLATKELRVFVYARPGQQRTGYDLVLRELMEAKTRLPQLAVVSAGEDWLPPNPGRNKAWWKHYGILDRKDTATLYRSCDIAIVLSFTMNPSLVALEAMACGCLLLTNERECTRWIAGPPGHESAVLFKPLPGALYRALIWAIENQSAAESIAVRGQTLAASRSWGEAIDTAFDTIVGQYD